LLFLLIKKKSSDVLQTKDLLDLCGGGSRGLAQSHDGDQVGIQQITTGGALPPCRHPWSLAAPPWHVRVAASI
jgi:hypothetical protein